MWIQIKLVLFGISFSENDNDQRVYFSGIFISDVFELQQFQNRRLQLDR